jgi:dihydrodipicolinate synthase/N-acetylneuraminate lyase
MKKHAGLDGQIREQLEKGLVIPAHPLALTAERRIDEQRQRMLTRYYMAAGAGGVAVGVHTTQFEIRRPGIGLFEPVLKMASEETESAGRPFVKVAGICGPVAQAMEEARLALKYGYHLGLLSMGGLADHSEEALLRRANEISSVIPLFGFYLQPAAGGRVLSYEFWREFVEIPNVYAIKIAAFNRYQTLDVVRAVCSSRRRDEIALYTGNDDNIVADLLTSYHFRIGGSAVGKRFVGGLLGHWAVWTSRAVALLEEIKTCLAKDGSETPALLTKGISVTDMNAVIFDAKNSFHGCIPGIHEILRRQGLLANRYCLDPREELSPGQAEEIDRICESYPAFTDDEFVRSFLKTNCPV